MSKISNIKFEMTLLIIVVILGSIALMQYITELKISLWVTWINALLLTVAIWRLIQKGSRKNKDKIPGKAFEFLFFFFLFLSTYAITFIASTIDEPEKILNSIYMNLLFMPALISAAYCGWLHYVEGIFNEKYWEPKGIEEEKKNMKIIKSDSRRFVLRNLVILISLTIILYLVTRCLVCPNSWAKWGIYFQIFGVILVSLWAILGGLWGTQSIAKYLKGSWQKMPYFLATIGLSFILAGLFLQL